MTDNIASSQTTTSKKSGRKTMIHLVVISLTYLFLVMLCSNIRHIFPHYNVALGISDGQMTLLMAILGWVALPGYFVGGWFADKFDPKKLIVISCFLTAATSFWLSTILFGINATSSINSRMAQLIIIYAFWGLIEGCLFYAASVKVLSFLAIKDNQVKIFAKSRWIVALVGFVVIIGLTYSMGLLNLKAMIGKKKCRFSFTVFSFVHLNSSSSFRIIYNDKNEWEKW